MNKYVFIKMLINPSYQHNTTDTNKVQHIKLSYIFYN